MDGAPASTISADYERRSVWLGVAAGLVLVLHGNPPFFVLYSTRIVDWQLWLYILSTLALAGCLILTGLNAFPQELRRLAPFAARWDPGRVLAWTFALFVLGLVITAAGGIAAAVDALGNHRFGQ